MSGKVGLLAGCLALTVLVGACSTPDADAEGGDQLESTEGSLPSPEADGPTFVSPAIGEEVENPVTFEIDPGPVDATGGTVPADAGGQFHLLIDQGCVENAEPLPVGTEGHVEFESGATEVTAELPVGAHEVCLQFGNAFDVAFYATDSITISVTG